MPHDAQRRASPAGGEVSGTHRWRPFLSWSRHKDDDGMMKRSVHANTGVCMCLCARARVCAHTNMHAYYERRAARSMLRIRAGKCVPHRSHSSWAGGVWCRRDDVQASHTTSQPCAHQHPPMLQSGCCRQQRQTTDRKGRPPQADVPNRRQCVKCAPPPKKQHASVLQTHTKVRIQIQIRTHLKSHSRSTPSLLPMTSVLSWPVGATATTA